MREEVVDPVEQGDALLERVGRADPERVGEVVVDLEGGADLVGVPLLLGVFVGGAEALCVLEVDMVAVAVVVDVPERLGGMVRVPEDVVDWVIETRGLRVVHEVAVLVRVARDEPVDVVDVETVLEARELREAVAVVEELREGRDESDRAGEVVVVLDELTDDVVVLVIWDVALPLELEVGVLLGAAETVFAADAVGVLEAAALLLAIGVGRVDQEGCEEIEGGCVWSAERVAVEVRVEVLEVVPVSVGRAAASKRVRGRPGASKRDPHPVWSVPSGLIARTLVHRNRATACLISCFWLGHRIGRLGSCKN